MRRCHSLLWVVAALLGLMAGCASNPKNPADPYENFNRPMDAFNGKVDKYVLKPVTDGYTRVVPQPARQSLSNAFSNLTYFDTILNDLLQGKGKQGGSDALRMLTNSTIGIAGLFDPATKLGLKKHSEDFGLTLGVWGVKQPHYLVLPFLGPTTGRDVWAWPVTYLCDPLTYVAMPLEAEIPLDAVRMIDFRASVENGVRFRDAAAIDPYIFTRHAYLAYREAQLNGGQPAATQPAIDYFEDEPPPMAPTTQPTMTPQPAEPQPASPAPAPGS